ncbi:alpha/beta fold hydrolase [Rhodoferax sp.]|uniref:alpha/beta fold hydrolase n=1 Tax=Rhodoferax sp. TaxID=50421 RepID=UPI00275E3C1D|nr:alpha/beta hydrolase [Rhodoferax sp.]
MRRIEVDRAQLEVQHIAANLSLCGTDRSVATLCPQPIVGCPPARKTPIVFLHEGLGSVAMWRDWPKQVCQATGREGWVYSRRGYGQSDPVPDVRGPPARAHGQRSGRLRPDYMHHEAWTVLPALLDELGLVAPVLLGHSDGASIALLHASRHAVAACVVMAPHVMVEDISVQSIEQARVAFESGELRARLAPYHADVDCAFWQWNDVWLSQGFRSFDIRLDCRSLHAPALAIQGTDDPYGSMDQIDQILLPAHQIERIRLPACGHSPHRDQTQLTTAHITRFLAEQP